ncbi:topoisomerase DNA-binding C4 zinc finger domain-containing protein [Aliiglaciecola sp. 3_MG-2023]|uniref:DNA topoisomerase family protein n=1 Tax=Aliiglaciecola sp. 3_MG-2023 TaxID=3062644 RepID=UPI0026E2F16E|nr:topoisomerase DNA-binding C4 zinc finger domain-containing protein [Aliiglaciecola sp. 3_MG-2023]MDO6695595.1 topoisomerase DNA-binding C4 zinc finger domain-containing protein [Aliiglaciecola sp. 3_MG-2023]
MSKIDHTLFAAHEHALDGDFGVCPDCGAKLQIKRGKNGAFLGCSQYPSCDFAKPLHDNSTVELKQIDGSECPECGLTLAIKKGRFGLFIGCTGYPDCHHIEAVKQQKDIHIACPSCKTGKLIKRTNKYGKSFYACDGYPKCKYILNSQPVDKACPKCHWSVLIEKKGDGKVYYQCPQKECGTKVAAESN